MSSFYDPDDGPTFDESFEELSACLVCGAHSDESNQTGFCGAACRSLDDWTDEDQHAYLKAVTTPQPHSRDEALEAEHGLYSSTR